MLGNAHATARVKQSTYQQCRRGHWHGVGVGWTRSGRCSRSFSQDPLLSRRRLSLPQIQRWYVWAGDRKTIRLTLFYKTRKTRIWTLLYDTVWGRADISIFTSLIKHNHHKEKTIELHHIPQSSWGNVRKFLLKTDSLTFVVLVPPLRLVYSRIPLFMSWKSSQFRYDFKKNSSLRQ